MDSLQDLLRALFPTNDGLRTFLANLDERNVLAVLDALPSPMVERAQYIQRTESTLLAHGLLTKRFFDKLCEEFPHRRSDVESARLAHEAKNYRDSATRSARAKKALLRSLLPFEDGDDLPGRETEVQDLLTILTSNDFRFGVVWGQSGCGKTSLLRAGLMPQLRLSGYRTAYVQRPAEDFPAQLRALLGQQRGDAARSEPIVIVVDQFEELFLLHKTKAEYAEVARFLADAMASEQHRLRVLVGIREDYFVKLHYLSPAIEDPTKPSHCYEIEELLAATARDILRESIETDDTHFDEELILAIVDDLQVDGRVRAAELQIVATHLKRRRVRQRREYDLDGKAQGVLQTYIQEEIERTGQNQEIAAFVLRRLCAVGKPIKSPTDVPEEDIANALAQAGLDAGKDRENLRAVLRRLKEARLIVQPDDGVYNLVHDFLAPLIGLATAGVETDVERANRLVAKYLGEYKEDPQFRIPWRHLGLIKKSANATALQDATTRKLMRASFLARVAQIALPLAATFAVVALIAYGFLPSFVYLSTKPTAFVGGDPTIVVRTGHPMLKYLPGFGGLYADLEYAMDDVTREQSEAVDAIPRESMVAWQWGKAASGYNLWADALSPLLGAAARTEWQRLLSVPQRNAFESAAPELTKGSFEVALSLGLWGAATNVDLSSAITQLKNVSATTNRAKFAKALVLAEIAQGRAADSGRATYRELFEIYESLAKEPENTEDNIDYEMRSNDKVLRLLMAADTGVVDHRDVQALLDLQAGDNFSPFRSWSVLAMLRTMADTDARLASVVVKALLGLVAAKDQSKRTQSAPWRLNDEIRSVVWIADSLPSAVTQDAFAPLASKIAKNELATLAFGALVARNPTLHIPGAIDSLRTCSSGKASDPGSEGIVAACSLALIRAGAVQPSQSILRPLLDEGKEETPFYERGYVAWSARRIALGVGGGPNPAFDAKSRSDFFKSNILLETRGKPSPDLEDSDPYGGFYEIAKMNPDIVQEDIIEVLIGICEKSKYAGAPAAAASVLLVAALWQPKYLIQHKEQLYAIRGSESLFNEQDGAKPLHELFVAAVARAEYLETQAQREVTPEDFRSRLGSSLDVEKRQTGAYWAFLLWLEHAAQKSSIEAELHQLAANTRPEIRASANKALEMIWIGKLTLVGANVSRGLARARLEIFLGHPEIHVQTAARLCMEKWLDK